MNKKSLIAPLIIVMAVWANFSLAWEAQRIKCKNPQAQQLADEAYDLLVDELSDQNIDKAITLMEKAIDIEPDNDMLWVELAGDLLERGERFPADTPDQRKARLKYFNRGLEASKKALKIRKSAASHFWYAANLGSATGMKSTAEGMAVLPHLARHVETSRKIDPHYNHGAATRFWTAIIPRLPEDMLSSIGVTPEVASREMEVEIKLDPLYFENRVILAVCFNHMGEKEKAIKQLAFVLSNKAEIYPDPAIHSLNREQQKRSKKLWKEWTGKDYPGR